MYHDRPVAGVGIGLSARDGIKGLRGRFVFTNENVGEIRFEMGDIVKALFQGDYFSDQILFGLEVIASFAAHNNMGNHNIGPGEGE